MSTERQCCLGDLDLDGWTVPGDWSSTGESSSVLPKWPSSSSTSDTSQEPRLLVVRQPEEQHRARYLSEGSRGAIKDRSGTSHCTIQLVGFYRATRVEIFAGTCSGAANSHQLYELIPVSGKAASTTPCRKIVARDGVRCLEIILRPEHNMTAVLDCVGVLKICSYDARRRSSKSDANCSVRLIFRAYLPFENGTESVIQCESEPVRCMQQLGVPEVLKMSCDSAPSNGGEELFIIGRNFDRNATVLFREYKDDGSLCWSAEATILRQFSHQCHIVCTIPHYPSTARNGAVSMTVRCGSKSSHPMPFHYIVSAEDVDDWRPPRSPDVFRDLKDNAEGDQAEGIRDEPCHSSRIAATSSHQTTLFRLGDDPNSNEVVPRKRFRPDSFLSPSDRLWLD